jgi:hypothetical protein
MTKQQGKRSLGVPCHGYLDIKIVRTVNNSDFRIILLLALSRRLFFLPKIHL